MKKIFFFLLVLSGFCFAEFTTFSDKVDTYTTVEVIIVDPAGYDMVSVRAQENPKWTKGSLTRERVSILVKRYGAVAGINGGFWKEDGTPAGILKIEDKWLGFPTKPRGSIGWKRGQNKPIIDQLLTEKTEDGIKVVPQSDYTKARDWQDLDFIVGGTPVLIRGGAVITDFSSEKTVEKFLVQKKFRTAIGVREDGCLVFVTVGSPYHIVFGGGMTMTELAHYMKSLDCMEALNLDGGSSSSMYVDNSKVDALASNNHSRKMIVSDAILILKK